MIRRLSYISLAMSAALAVVSISGCNRSEPEPSSAMIDASSLESAAAAEAAEAAITKQASEEKPKAKKAARRPASKATKNVYVVQLGAFKVKENAERFQTQIKSSGFPVIMQSLNHSKNGQMYVVRIEPTPNREEAMSMLSSLKEKNISGQLLALPDEK